MAAIEGMDYVVFVGTGMVGTAILFSSAFGAMYGVFIKHRFQRTYDAILAGGASYGRVTRPLLNFRFSSAVRILSPLWILATISCGTYGVPTSKDGRLKPLCD